MSSFEHIHDFKQAMSVHGITPPETIVTDGKIHRFGHKKIVGMYSMRAIYQAVHLVTGNLELMKIGAANNPINSPLNSAKNGQKNKPKFKLV